MKTLLFILLLPLQMLAQDLSGIWTGYIQTAETNLPYELVISSGKDKMSGYSLTVFTFNGVENIGVKSMKLKSKNGRIALEDDELLYNNFSTPPRKVKLLADLVLKTENSNMILAGSFFTRSLDFRATNQNLFTGTIYLQKQQDNSVQTKLIPKLGEMNLLASLSFTVTPAENKQTATAPVPTEEFEMPVEKERSQTVGISRTTVVKASPRVLQPRLKELPPPPAIAAAEVELPALKETERKLATTQRFYVSARPKTLQPTLKGVPPPSIIYLASTEPKPQLKPQPKPQPPRDTAAITVAPQKPIQSVTTRAATTTPTPVIAAVDLDKRKTEIIRSVSFTSDSLLLTLYDNGTIDGDTVSVVLNGRVIIAKKGLTANAIRTTVQITPDLGDSLQLVMYAENLGSIPPNTGLLIIQDGDVRHDIRFAGDMQKSSAIILRRKR